MGDQMVCQGNLPDPIARRGWSEQPGLVTLGGS